MKSKIQIKSVFETVLFEYKCDDNTIKKTVEEAVAEKADLRLADLSFANLRFADLSSADLSSADLSSADLSSADLRFANLSSADLSSADLRFANLSSADLRSADLSSADLRSADLSSADLPKRFITVSQIGSRKDMTIYCFDEDKIWCGCWTGTLTEFEKRVKETHKNNSQYLAEYLGFIKYVRELKNEN